MWSQLRLSSLLTFAISSMMYIARKSIVELAVEGSVAPIDFGGELLKADNVFSNFLVTMHF